MGAQGLVSSTHPDTPSGCSGLFEALFAIGWGFDRVRVVKHLMTYGSKYLTVIYVIPHTWTTINELLSGNLSPLSIPE